MAASRKRKNKLALDDLDLFRNVQRNAERDKRNVWTSKTKFYPPKLFPYKICSYLFAASKNSWQRTSRSQHFWPLFVGIAQRTASLVKSNVEEARGKTCRGLCRAKKRRVWGQERVPRGAPNHIRRNWGTSTSEWGWLSWAQEVKFF